MKKQTTADIAIEIEADMVRLNQWMTRFKKAYRAGMTTVIRKTGLDLMADIMESTPVDTGRARMGWTGLHKKLGVSPPTIQIPPGKGKKFVYSQTSPGFKISAEAARQEGAMLSDCDDNTKNKKDPHFIVSNSVNYILPLEGGHSEQAGPGVMVRNNLGRFTRHFMEQVDKKMIEKCKESQK